MNLNEYQKAARETAIYPKMDTGDITYCTLGLTGEAGEVAEKVKKVLRDQNGQFHEFNRTDIRKELGDVLWYIANIACELGIEMEDIAKTNIHKLKSRSKRGKLGGSGDNR